MAPVWKFGDVDRREFGFQCGPLAKILQVPGNSHAVLAPHPARAENSFPTRSSSERFHRTYPTFPGFPALAIRPIPNEIKPPAIRGRISLLNLRVCDRIRGGPMAIKLAILRGANVRYWPGAAFVAHTCLVAIGGKADAAGSRANDAIDPFGHFERMNWCGAQGTRCCDLFGA
jgi:hypothetical protein